MARFSAAGRATIAGTAALPLVSLYATAAVTPEVLEIGLFNTTATACSVAVNRLTTTGTQGAAITPTPEDDPVQAPVATPRAGHTVGPTITPVAVRQASLGAAIGSGVIWTWPENHPLTIPAATTAGIGIVIPAGTGQVLDYYILWME